MKLLLTRSLVVAPLLLPACTLAMMQQMSDPTEAEEPEHVSWPEAEALAAQASADFTARRGLASRATQGWAGQGRRSGAVWRPKRTRTRRG